MAFSDLMQKYVNMSYDELVARAKRTLSKLIPVFDEASSDGHGSKVLIALILTSVAADGNFSQLEYKFINDVFCGIEYDKARELVASHYSDAAQEALDNFIDALNDDTKAQLLELVTCAIAVDETINKDEITFIRKLIAN